MKFYGLAGWSLAISSVIVQGQETNQVKAGTSAGRQTNAPPRAQSSLTNVTDLPPVVVTASPLPSSLFPVKS